MYTINNVRSSALRDLKRENRNEIILSVVCGIVFAVLSVSFFI